MNIQLILYNQINENFFSQGENKKFLYIHNTGNPCIPNTVLKLNKKSKILDYAQGYNFIDELQRDWYQADFIIAKNYRDWILEYCTKNNINEVYIAKPSEPYLEEIMKNIQNNLKEKNIEVHIYEKKYWFYLSHEEFSEYFPKWPPILETFYRFMRKKFQILLEDDGKTPLGWKWNYDAENRKFDKNHIPLWSEKIKENLWVQKAKEFYGYQKDINIPTTRQEALAFLDAFIKKHLDNFWKLEDAMYTDDLQVHHSLLSSSINFWLLSPQEVIDKVASSNTALNNKEGFIRQVLWWREYMYHFFSFYKDTLYQENTFDFQNKLPDFFRDTNKKSGLHCLDTVLERVLEENYSHHIERLMIIGNFCLLVGIHPAEVNTWFFEQYIDAFEWVVTPNVMSMSQFADNGKLATKPYVSSGNYINKMSNFCKDCKYNVTTKYDENSCPFNYLYWSFVDEQKETFQKGRQSFVIKNLEKIEREKVQELKKNFIKKMYF